MSISGLVGFVGLIVPHIVRLIVGPDHRLLLPASMLTGAAFLVIVDLIARIVLSPSEVPLGVVTAIVRSAFLCLPAEADQTRVYLLSDMGSNQVRASVLMARAVSFCIRR